MSGGGTQNSLRRALGALKDSTTVSLAKVNSDYKVFSYFKTLMKLLLWLFEVGFCAKAPIILVVWFVFSGIGYCNS